MAKPRKRRALGKGLNSILPTETTAEQAAEIVEKVTSVEEIPLSQIETNPFQPRVEFDEEALSELANSIGVHGIIQPLTLRKLSDKSYQLIAGERRLRASKMAGLKAVPAYIRTADDEQMLEMALIENIQREDLNPVEIALSYQRMIDELGLKQSDLGNKVGKKRSTVTNYLRLLKLSPEIQDGLRKKEITMGHGRALITLESQVQQSQAFQEIVEKSLSVRQTEALVRKLQQPPEEKKAEETGPEDIHLRKVSKQLEDKFGSKINLSQNSQGQGALTIKFNSTKDLNRILEIMDL